MSDIQQKKILPYRPRFEGSGHNNHILEMMQGLNGASLSMELFRVDPDGGIDSLVVGLLEGYGDKIAKKPQEEVRAYANAFNYAYRQPWNIKSQKLTAVDFGRYRKDIGGRFVVLSNDGDVVVPPAKVLWNQGESTDTPLELPDYHLYSSGIHFHMQSARDHQGFVVDAFSEQRQTDLFGTSPLVYGGDFYSVDHIGKLRGKSVQDAFQFVREDTGTHFSSIVLMMGIPQDKDHHYLFADGSYIKRMPLIKEN